MKKSIRREVFETNSSMTHSLIIMPTEQEEKWEKEDLYYYNPSDWYDPFKKLPEEQKKSIVVVC